MHIPLWITFHFLVWYNHVFPSYLEAGSLLFLSYDSSNHSFFTIRPFFAACTCKRQISVYMYIFLYLHFTSLNFGVLLNAQLKMQTEVTWWSCDYILRLTWDELSVFPSLACTLLPFAGPCPSILPSGGSWNHSDWTRPLSKIITKKWYNLLSFTITINSSNKTGSETFPSSDPIGNQLIVNIDFNYTFCLLWC